MRNLNKHKLIGYAEAFLAFLLSDAELWKKEYVRQIILFGSVVREEAAPSSDIDLFVEVYDLQQTDFVKKRSACALAEFYKSHVAKEWTLRGTNNEIKILVGKLDQMSDLKRSLVSDGMVLYGKYSAKVEAEHYVLVSFIPIKEKSRRYRVDRHLFGRHEATLSTEGIIKPLGGKRLDTRVFVLPIKQAPAVIKYLKSENVKFAMHEVWSDTL